MCDRKKEKKNSSCVCFLLWTMAKVFDCRIDSLKRRYLYCFFTFPLNTPGSDPLVRQLYEFEQQIEDPTSMLTPMSRSLWKYRRQVTVEHLGNSFQQETQSTAVNQYKVLGAFLKQVTLREVYMVEISSGDRQCFH